MYPHSTTTTRQEILLLLQPLGWLVATRGTWHVDVLSVAWLGGRYCVLLDGAIMPRGSKALSIGTVSGAEGNCIGVLGYCDSTPLTGGSIGSRW